MEELEARFETVIPFQYTVYLLDLLAVMLIAYPFGLYFLVARVGLSMIAIITSCFTALSGIFLGMNATLFASMLRLRHEVEKFKETNAAFESDINENATTIRKLQKAALAFEEIDRQFGGSVQKAVEDVDKVRATLRMKTAMNCQKLIRLYADTGKSRFLEKGEELENTFKVLKNVFGSIIDDYTERSATFKDLLYKNEDFLSHGGVDVNVFSKAMEAALLAQDVDSVAEAVEAILEDKKEEA